MSSISPEEIAQRFADAAENFPACVGRPDFGYAQDLRDELASVLVEIPYDLTNGRDNLIALVLPDAEYTAEFSQAFSVPAKVGIYDTTIADEAQGAKKKKAEAEHEAKRIDRASYDAAVRGGRKFVLDKVEDTWVRTLRQPTFVYSRVSIRDLLNVLTKNAPGTRAPDRIDLINKMQGYFAKAPGIPEYINMLEDAQKRAKAIDAKKEVKDETLVDIAVASVVKSGHFQRADEDWDRLPADDQTWAKWKDHYLEAHELQRARADAGGGANSFGGARAGAAPAGTFEEEYLEEEDLDVAGAATVGDLEACMEDLALAAKTEQATLASLVRSNASLTATNSRLAEELEYGARVNRSLHSQLRRAKESAGEGPPPSLEEEEAKAKRQAKAHEKRGKAKKGKKKKGSSRGGGGRAAAAKDDSDSTDS